MNSDQKLPGFLANRSVADRRTGKLAAPPYATGTGVVLIERRSGIDRRAAADQARAVAEQSDKIETPISQPGFAAHQ
jgi:hypothetical protein